MRKDDPRVAAYGDVDELNAVLGVVLAQSAQRDLSGLLRRIQRDLFALGAQLADPHAGIGKKRAKAAFAALAPNTNPSNNELLASRLAPCTPLQATSPAANSPGTVVAPFMSVRTPPII